MLIPRNHVQASKRSNMGSAVLVVGRFVDIQDFSYQGAKRSDMDCVELKGVYLLIVRKGIFRLLNFGILAVLVSNEVDFLMLNNRVYRLRNVQIWAVLSW